MTRAATATKGKAQRIATVITEGEVCRLMDGTRKYLTVGTIVDRYGLDFGRYEYDNGRSLDVAGQVVRNALTDEFKRGELLKIKLADGSILRRKGQIVFVSWAQRDKRAKWLRGELVSA